MHTIIENQKNIVTKIIISVGALLGLFLLVATLVKAKEYRFVGSGLTATNTITVSGFGKLDRTPDTAKVTFSVEDMQKNLRVAQENVSRKIEAITKELKVAGIEEKYIKTDAYSSYPEYEYTRSICTVNSCPPSGTPVLKGYRITHSLTVSVKNLETVENILGILGNGGVTNISGPNLGFEDEKFAQREARDIAISDAKNEAEKLANALGVKLVRIVSFSESGNGIPQPMDESRTMAIDAKVQSGVAPRIPIGAEDVQSNVTLVYEIQ